MLFLFHIHSHSPCLSLLIPICIHAAKLHRLKHTCINIIFRFISKCISKLTVFFLNLIQLHSLLQSWLLVFHPIPLSCAVHFASPLLWNISLFALSSSTETVSPFSVATVMDHVSTLFKWRQYACIYDVGAPYQGLAKSISEGSSDFVIKSSHMVSPHANESDIEDIFEQVRKYTRSKYLITLSIIERMCLLFNCAFKPHLKNKIKG